MKYYGIDHVLRDMGVSDKLIDAGGDIQLVSFRHGMSKLLDNGDWQAVGEQRYEVNGKSYRYTGAWYNFAMDEVNGGKFYNHHHQRLEWLLEADRNTEYTADPPHSHDRN